MAAIDPWHIKAATTSSADVRTVGIVLQAQRTLMDGLVLSFVTCSPVLSVPVMNSANSPTMLTVDIAYRINSHGDYAVANALCLMSLALASVGAWFYLREAARKAERG